MRPKIKKPTFDALLKALAIFVLFVAGILGIGFGASSAVNAASAGPAYAGTVSAKVYFSPYKETANQDATRDLDFAQPRDVETTEAMSDAEISAMLQQAAQTYADRMSAQGFSQVAVSENPADAGAATDATLLGLTADDQSWFLPVDVGGKTELTMPSLTVTVDKPNPQNNSDTFYEEAAMREAMLAAGRDYGLSLETTDGYTLMSSHGDDEAATISFVAGSAAATTPPATSSSSALTLELRTPSAWNAADGGAQSALDDLENAVTAAGGTGSDYFVGDGRSSVEGAGKLFAASGSDASQGNRNIILWSDKEGALLYARWLFNATDRTQVGLNAYLSLSSAETAFGDFLHGRGSYAPGSDGALSTPITSAADITLSNLYYLIASPTAYAVDKTDTADSGATASAQSARASLQADNAAATAGGAASGGASGTGDATSTSNNVTTPDGTRSALGGSSNFESLFAPYLLYEFRTTDSSAIGTPSTMLSSMFQAGAQITKGGDTLLTLTQGPSGSGSYAQYTYSQTTNLAQLLNRGAFPAAAGVVGVSTPDDLQSPQLVHATFQTDSAAAAGGMTAFGSSILALGVFLMAVGIIVSVFYRVPGALAVVPTLLAGALAFLLYATFGQTVDLFGFGALFAVLAGGIGCVVYVLETFRRHVRNSVSYGEAFRLAFKNTFMKVVDVHLSYLVLGLFLTYLGQYQESAYGVILIVGAFTSFFLLYGAWVLFVKLFMSFRNWTDGSLFVFRRDAKWQGEITGQLDAADRAALNAASLSADAEIAGLLKQHHKENYMSPLGMGLAGALALAVFVLGVVSLGLNASGQAWPLSASTVNAGTNILWSAFATVLISAAYFTLRYRWHVLAPYLVGSLLNFLACASALLLMSGAWDASAQFEAVAAALGAFTVGQASLVFLIGWFGAYYTASAAYGQAALLRLINDNVASARTLVAFTAGAYPLGYFAFALFNVGGEGFLEASAINGFLFTLFGVALLSALLCALCAHYGFGVALGGFMRLQRIVAARLSSRARAPKAHAERDPFDEQEIAGINARPADGSLKGNVNNA